MFRQEKRFSFALLFSLIVIIAAAGSAVADSVTLPSDLTIVEAEAFRGNVSLEQVVINNGCLTVEDYSFADCTELNSVRIPQSVISIGEHAFDSCQKLVAKVFQDSYAHHYCMDNSVPYEIINQEYLISLRENMLEGMHDVLVPYLDSENYIPKASASKAISAMVEYLKEQLAFGSITEYAYDSNGVSFIDAAASGLWVWTPRIEDQLSGGEEVQMNVLTYEPFYNSQSQFHNNSVSASANNITSSILYYSNTKNLTDSQVTLQEIRNISSNQVVIWYGHGGYVAKKGVPYLATGDIIYPENSSYIYGGESDIDKIEILNRAIPEINAKRTCITPSFIKYRCKRMENSLIWIGACFSGKSDELAKAFLNKGAKAVVGFSNETGIKYCGRVTKLAFEKLLTIDNSTAKHYMLKKAVNEATQETNQHSFLYPNPHGGIPQVYMNNKFTDYSLWHGTIKGYIYEKADEEKKNPAKNVNISFYSNYSNEYTLSVYTDETGYFEAKMPEDNYTAFLAGDKYISTNLEETIEADVTKSVTWYISKAGILKGTVISDENKLLKGARVALENSSTSSITDENGRFELAMTQPSGNIVVSLDGYQDSEPIYVEVETDEEQEITITLSLLKGYVSGYVKDSIDQNKMVENAIITITDIGENPVEVNESNAITTLSNGFYMFSIKPGTYILTASKVGYYSSTATVTVKSAESHTQDFSLEPYSYTITFDANGGTVSEATKAVVQGDPIGELPTATKDGASFKEWNTESDGTGSTVTDDTIPEGDMVVYAVWDEAGAILEGTVFECMSNNYVSGATVELHHGMRRVLYTNYDSNYQYTETIVTEEEYAEYDEAPLQTVITDSNGYYCLTIPLEGEPNYRDVYYGYTIVIKKEGWITRVDAFAFKNAEEVSWRNPQLYGLAPEGEGVRYTGTDASGYMYYDRIVHPYSNYEFSFSGNYVDRNYLIKRVSIYMNGSYKAQYTAPSYVYGTDWRLGTYSAGSLYIRNKLYDTINYKYLNNDSSGTYVFPSWRNN